MLGRILTRIKKWSVDDKRGEEIELLNENEKKKKTQIKERIAYEWWKD